MTDNVHIGTSGWSYDDWVGPFYPAGAPKREFLSHYATQFDVVEVDSTYYAIPARRMVQGWAERTPKGFRFALKAPQEITHKRVLVDCQEGMERFLGALEPLGEKTVCVLLQFGYFNRATFRSAKPFFERLNGFLREYVDRVPLAVEIRNKNWLTDAYFDLLRSHKVAAALVEHAWLPPINHVVEQHDVVTGPFSYVRLIGDRKGIEEITRTWDKVVMDRSADLRRVARAIRQIAQRVPVHTFVNNHYAGHGPETSRQLRAACEDV
ncbi:MAG TPA: DUF72 domain-containing protein [Phycisphaerae bacterium]|nr:DUF72 domain-containing protein [Phycisphaerae bacterium]